MGIKSASVILIANEVSHYIRLALSQMLCLGHTVSHVFCLYHNDADIVVPFHEGETEAQGIM